jgi:hypothetical protein
MACPRHTRALDSEVARQGAEIDRLRAENRALLNSILGIAGIPPVPITTFTPLSPADGHSESPTHSRGGDESPVRPTSSTPHSATRSDSSPRQSEARNDSPSAASASIGISAAKIIHAAAPSSLSPIRRRRSWHQINRILELESARKPATSD